MKSFSKCSNGQFKMFQNEWKIRINSSGDHEEKERTDAWDQLDTETQNLSAACLPLSFISSLICVWIYIITLHFRQKKKKKKSMVLHRIHVWIFRTSEYVASFGKGFADVINFSILTWKTILDYSAGSNIIIRDLT